MAVYTFVGGIDTSLLAYGVQGATFAPSPPEYFYGFTESLSGSFSDAANFVGPGAFYPNYGVYNTVVPGAGDTVVLTGIPDGFETPVMGPTIPQQQDGGGTLEGYYGTLSYVGGAEQTGYINQFLGYTSSGGFQVTGATGTIATLQVSGPGTLGLGNLTVTTAATFTAAAPFINRAIISVGSIVATGYAPVAEYITGGTLDTPSLTLTTYTDQSDITAGSEGDLGPPSATDSGSITIEDATLSGNTTQIMSVAGPSTDTYTSTPVLLNGATLDASTELDLVGVDPATYPNSTAPTALDAVNSTIDAGAVVIATGTAGLHSGSSGSPALLTLEDGSTMIVSDSTGIGSLIVGDTGDGTLDTMSSVISDNQAIVANSFLSTGTVVVDNTEWANGGALTVGQDGVGTVTIQDGAEVLNSGSDGYADIAFDEDAAGSAVTVTGDGSEWQVDQYLFVGTGADGTLAVTDSGQVDVDNLLVVGLIDGVTGTLDITAGGTVTAASANGPGTTSTEIGDSEGSTGLVTIDGAGSVLEDEDALSVGYSGDGSLTITYGGLLQLNGTIMRVGRNEGATGLVDVSDDGSAIIGDSATMYVGYGGTGEVTIESGATLNVQAVDLGGESTGDGTLTLDGEDVSASVGDLTLGGAGDGTLDLTSGASLTLTGSLDIAVEANSSGALNLGDPVDFEVTGGAILGDGGNAAVYINGAAQVMFDTDITAAAQDGSTADITVTGDNSLLQVNGDMTLGALGDATLLVSDGGALNVTGDLTLGEQEGGTGGLTIDGDETMVTIMGDTTVGDAGDGNLTLQNAADIQIGGPIILGAQDGSTGVLDISGMNTSLTATDDVTVGDGGESDIDLSEGGALTVDGALNEGVQETATGIDTVDGQHTNLQVQGDWTLAEAGMHETDITGGAMANVDGAFVIAADEGSEGTLSLDGQDSTLTTGGGGVTLGESGDATVMVGPGATFDGSADDVTAAENAGSEVHITLTGDTNSGLSGELDASSLTIGGSGDATLEASDGATVMVGDDMTIAEQAGATGSVTISGDGTDLSVGGDLTIGDEGTGTLTLSGDGASAEVNGDAKIAESRDATLAVQGGAFDTSGTLTIGAGGNGLALVQLGGTLSAGALTIGEAAGGTGELDVTGATATINGDLIDGSSGSGTFKVTESGALVVDGDITVADQAVGIAQSFTLDTGGTLFAMGNLAVGGSGIGGGEVLGGSQLVVAGQAVIGDMPGAGGTLTVSGTAANTPSTFTFGTLEVGNEGTGALTIANGALAGGPTGRVTPTMVMIGVAADGDGTVTVTGSHSILHADTIDVGSAAGGRGTLDITAGGTVEAADVTVFASGALSLSDASLLTDPLTLEGGAVIPATGTITGDVLGDGSLSITAGGSLTLTGAVASGITVDFSPHGTETLTLDLPGSFTGSISDFVPGDVIDLGSAPDVSSSFVDDTLTVTSDGVQIAFLHFNGNYQDNSIGVQAVDGVVEVSQPCYVRGTRIGTPNGERPIEKLRPGDLVLASGADGVFRPTPVRWAGRRVLDLTTHRERELAAPIRLRAGALGPGLPVRDLVVSPDHCLLLDDHLLRAYRLLNGVSVVQEYPAKVEYWHLELDAHALLLAEGVPAESYLDEGTRDFFDVNGAQLPGPLGPRQIAACVPYAPDDAFAERIWCDVAGRAAAGPPSPASLRGVHVFADGRPLRPLLAEGDRRLYALPPAAETLRLVSDAVRPTATKPWLQDRRRLGIGLRRVRFDSGMVLPLDGPGFARGWHNAEPGIRWSEGDAALRLPPQVCVVDLHVAHP